MTIDKGNSAIEFRLDPDSGVPTYLQLVQQVEHALRLGYLKPGDQLPKVRDVVASLAIKPNRVTKSYRVLDDKSLATSFRRSNAGSACCPSTRTRCSSHTGSSRSRAGRRGGRASALSSRRR